MQISIDRTPEKNNYPIISFMFRNSGTADALLWKFFIEILNCELDLEPVFRLSLNANENGALVIGGSNQGWGPIENLKACISLERDGSELAQRNMTSIVRWNDGGEEQNFLLPASDDLIGELVRRSAEIPSRANGWGYWQGSGTSTPELLRIDSAQLIWTCTDALGRACSGATTVAPPHDSFLCLTEQGFRIGRYDPVMARYAGPDTLYCSILDPRANAHRREYGISRIIKPGEVDYFQLVVGSKQSARFLMKIGFHADEKDIITSKEFDVSILHPRDAKKHNWNRYLDGDEIRLPTSEAGATAKSDWRSGRHSEKLEENRKAFPFLAADRHSRW